MIREISNAKHNAVLRAILKGDAIKAVAADHAICHSTVRKVARHYHFSPMLVLPAERDQLLRTRGLNP